MDASSIAKAHKQPTWDSCRAVGKSIAYQGRGHLLLIEQGQQPFRKKLSWVQLQSVAEISFTAHSWDWSKEILSPPERCDGEIF